MDNHNSIFGTTPQHRMLNSTTKGVLGVISMLALTTALSLPISLSILSIAPVVGIGGCATSCLVNATAATLLTQAVTIGVGFITKACAYKIRKDEISGEFNRRFQLSDGDYGREVTPATLIGSAFDERDGVLARQY